MKEDKIKFITEEGLKLGASEEAIRKWLSRGVSHKYRYLLLQLAKQKRFPLTYKDLMGPKE